MVKKKPTPNIRQGLFYELVATVVGPLRVQKIFSLVNVAVMHFCNRCEIKRK